MSRRPFEPDWRHARRICLDQARRWRLSPADADDVVQASLDRAWRRLHTLQDPDRFDGWLVAICRNEVLRLLERRTDHFEIDEAATRATEDPASALAAAVDLRRTLRDLAPQDRMLVWLRFVEDLPYREIAGLTGLTEVAVRLRIHRLRRRLGS